MQTPKTGVSSTWALCSAMLAPSAPEPAASRDAACGRERVSAGALFAAASHSHERAYCTQELCHCTAYLRCQVQTMLEHLITRKPAGVCTDSFNHLLIACTLTVLKHLKATNTAFPLSSTPFQGTELALSKFAIAALNKPNAEHEIKQELRIFLPPTQLLV